MLKKNMGGAPNPGQVSRESIRRDVESKLKRQNEEKLATRRGCGEEHSISRYI